MIVSFEGGGGRWQGGGVTKGVTFEKAYQLTLDAYLERGAAPMGRLTGALFDL